MSQGQSGRGAAGEEDRSDCSRAGELAGLQEQDFILSTKGRYFNLTQMSDRIRLHFKKSSLPLESRSSWSSLLEQTFHN